MLRNLVKDFRTPAGSFRPAIGPRSGTPSLAIQPQPGSNRRINLDPPGESVLIEPMTTDASNDYPAEAYAPNGILWWKLRYWPGSTTREYGDERKLAAWMAFNVNIGETFTMRDLRTALGGDVIPNDAEHLNRRLRELRKDGWSVPSNKDDRNLPVGTYRLETQGWHPGEGKRPARNTISQATRRRVLDRDGWRCVVCGVGSGEPYPGEPGTNAVLTAGHRVPNAFGGSSRDINNLQAECKRCNEPVRQELRSPETLEQVLPDVRRLKKSELETLLSWLVAEHRTRNRLDDVYDRARRLSAGEQDDLEATVRGMVTP